MTENEFIKLVNRVENDSSVKNDFELWEDLYKKLINKVFKVDDNTYKINKCSWNDKKFENKYKVMSLTGKSFNDVFSFLIAYNKYGYEKRIEIAKIILGENDFVEEYNKLKFLGVPAGQQGISEEHFNKYLNDDDNDGIDNITNELNRIAYNLINNTEEFEDINNIFIKYSLPTMYRNVLYFLKPEKYYPDDKNTKKARSILGINELVYNSHDTNYTRKVSYCAWLLENKIETVLDKLIKKNTTKNIILTGIPGTGKTHAINEYLRTNKIKKSRYKIVQFHPSYDYEDFIEGLKPVPGDKGIEFKLIDGVFKELCKEAYKNENETYFMIIDEINRADLSRVFGELLYCLEYRGKLVDTRMTTYIQSMHDNNPESAKKHSICEKNIGQFCIPKNIIVLGTMNEVDRSIDAFDLALRRRFIWEELGFSEDVLRLYLLKKSNIKPDQIDKLIEKSKKINKDLTIDIGSNYQIGHTYFFKIKDYYNGYIKQARQNLWDFHLSSIIKEYCKIKFSEKELEDKLKKYKRDFVG